MATNVSPAEARKINYLRSLMRIAENARAAFEAAQEIDVLNAATAKPAWDALRRIFDEVESPFNEHNAHRLFAAIFFPAGATLNVYLRGTGIPATIKMRGTGKYDNRLYYLNCKSGKISKIDFGTLMGFYGGSRADYTMRLAQLNHELTSINA